MNSNVTIDVNEKQNRTKTVSLKRFLIKFAIRDFLVDGALVLLFLPTVIVYCNATLRSLSKIPNEFEDMFQEFVIPMFWIGLIADVIIQCVVLGIFYRDYKKISASDRTTLWDPKVEALCVDRYYITHNTTIYWANFEKRISPTVIYKKKPKSLYAYRGSLDDIIKAIKTTEIGKPLTDQMRQAVEIYEKKYDSDEFTLVFLFFAFQVRYLFVPTAMDLGYRIGAAVVFFIWMLLKKKYFPPRRDQIRIFLYISFLIIFCWCLFLLKL